MDAYKKELLIIKIQNVFIFIIKLLTFALPLKNYIIMESHPDLSDNTFVVYEELIKRGYNKKYKIFWFLNKEKPDLEMPKNVYLQSKMTGGLFNKLKAKWISARAKFIIDSNLYVYKVHKKQKRIHLKHGAPIKDAFHYTQNIRDVDLICVPSEYWIKVGAEEYLVSDSIVKPLGFPRNDVLKPKNHKNTIVMWMPTYRKLLEDNRSNCIFDKLMPIGLPLVDDIASLREINEVFALNDAYLLIRLHPAQNLSGINLKEMTNIKFCDNKFLADHNVTLYTVLSYTDALITDYSSVYFDYLMLEKPIALAIPDFNEYKKHFGVLADDCNDFKKRYPAVFLETKKDLMDFFNRIFSAEESAYVCSEAKEKYMGNQDFKSAERIVNYLEQNMGL